MVHPHQGSDRKSSLSFTCRPFILKGPQHCRRSSTAQRRSDFRVSRAHCNNVVSHRVRAARLADFSKTRIAAGIICTRVDPWGGDQPGSTAAITRTTQDPAYQCTLSPHAHTSSRVIPQSKSAEGIAEHDTRTPSARAR